jgi:hypothetical protein
VKRWHVALIALGGLLSLGMITGLITVYGVGNGALNAGVVVGTSAHSVGMEWRGVPGFFVNGS